MQYVLIHFTNKEMVSNLQYSSYNEANAQWHNEEKVLTFFIDISFKLVITTNPTFFTKDIIYIVMIKLCMCLDITTDLLFHPLPG